MARRSALFSHVRRLAAAASAAAALGLSAAAMSGCTADEPLNPSFALTLADSKLALREMTREPRPFDRPVVVLGGIYDPGVVASVLGDRLRRLSGEPDQVISVSFFGLASFDRCRDRVIRRVDEKFPTDDPAATVEVDVVGVSMGGLVARYAAAPRGDGGRRLRIRRLYTISTPHRGAQMATLPTVDRRALDMRPGSAFLEALDDALAELDYLIIAYTRLDDAVVGEANTAPTGHAPFWVPNVPGSFAHLFATDDPRILADIARRLRGETPYTIEPPMPLPSRATDTAAPAH